MKLSLRLATAASLLPLTLIAETAPAAPDWNARGQAWFAHVQYLASDDLQGRRTGSPGYAAAVAYVESQFKAIGLKPGGTSGYQQSFDLIPTTIDTAASSFAVDDKAYKLGEAVNLGVPGTPNDTVDAPMVFIGYGMSVPRKHIDDLAGLDVKGKVVVFYNAAPENLQGPQRAYARGLGVRWQALHAAGAIGIIQIAPPRPGSPPPSTAAPATGSANRPAPAPALIFADPELSVLGGLKLVATLTPEGAKTFFADSGHEFADIKALADKGQPLPHFVIPGTVHARTVTTAGAVMKAPNVVGLLEGSDRSLKKQYVVVSAHLDHLGVGRPVDGDTVYNGAMDNASGVASVIESARLIAAGPRPKRSILFIALAGEELGELGSQYFATKPTVPKADIVADLNMDMYLPLFPLRFLEIQGLGESTLGNDARAICQLNDVEPQFDKQPDENRFVRSDQVNFVKQGIPALAFKFGWTPDSPEMKTFNEWVKVRYHRPSDDLQQPIDKAAAAQFTSILAQLSTRVANSPTRPEWYPESSFSTIGK